MRSLALLGLAAGVLYAATWATATPAYAAEDATVLLSLDGQHFSADPAGSVFPEQVILIPGGHTSATIWVRNPSSVPAALTLAVADPSPSSLGEALALQAGTPATEPGEPVSLGEGLCRVLLAGEILQPGATTPVTIVLGMAADSTNETQQTGTSASLRVTLQDASAGVPAAPAECLLPTPAPGPTADTAPPSGTNDADAPSTGASTQAGSGAVLTLLGEDHDSGAHGSETSPAGATPSTTGGGVPPAGLPTLSLPDQPVVQLAAFGATLLAGAATVLLVNRKKAALLLNRKRGRS